MAVLILPHLGCLRVLAASTALAKVPTLRLRTRNWSMALSVSEWWGLHTCSERSMIMNGDEYYQVLQISLLPGILLLGDDGVQGGHLGLGGAGHMLDCHPTRYHLVIRPYLDLPSVLEQRLVGPVVDERVEEDVLRLYVGEQRLCLV